MAEISLTLKKWRLWDSSTRALGADHFGVYSNMRPVEVAAGLLFHEGKLLITQRAAGVHLGGLWEFPGGKRETDESFEDCLRREFSEELGLDVEVQELIQTVVHSYA